MEIQKNVQAIRERMAAACHRSGRSADEVTLVAVTKTVGAEQVEAVIAAGVTVIGENRVQEATAKKQAVSSEASWHLIGHLQTNKVKKALKIFDLIESVDSEHLAEKIQQESEKLQRTVDVFIQVNTSGEQSKFGVAPEHALSLVRSVSKLPNLRLRGLMTIGALSDDEDRIRSCFRMLRQIREQVVALNLPGVSMEHLSMGMTNDFEIAIEEGATLIRIGRALFGERMP